HASSGAGLRHRGCTRCATRRLRTAVAFGDRILHGGWKSEVARRHGTPWHAQHEPGFRIPRHRRRASLAPSLPVSHHQGGMGRAMIRVGLISDTHGLLRPEALDFLEGSDHIVHGGDICDAGVFEALSALAPVTAVRGNNDDGSWASRLRETELL